jgi:putative DNA primase/helicase
MQQPAENKMITLTNFDQFVLDCLWSNQDGDAKLYTHLNHLEFCFDHNEGRWYIFKKHYWSKDKKAKHFTAVDKIIDLYEKEAQRQFKIEVAAIKAGDTKKVETAQANRTELLKRIKSLQANHRKKYIVEIASWGDRGLGINGDEWDRHPTLLPCKNGVIDLETGELAPGNKAQYLRSPCPTEYDPNAPEPELFIKFLSEIFDQDSELIDYIQRLFGYSLLGEVIEHILPIFWGSGRNGKDTLIQAISYVLGPVAKPIDVELLLDKKSFRSSGNASPDIIDLWGKRIVWASETNQTRKLNAGMVKMLTGGNILTGRALYANDYTTFYPSHTPFLITNHKPHASASDVALWHRIHLIPFKLAFVDNPVLNHERKQDKNIAKNLKAESSQILKWMVDGCLHYQEKGLLPPDVVTEATEEYRQDEDTIGRFINECCQIGDSFEVKAGELYGAYKEWCETNGYRHLNQKNFGSEIKARFDSYKMQYVFYVGLKLLDSLDSLDSS